MRKWLSNFISGIFKRKAKEVKPSQSAEEIFGGIREFIIISPEVKNEKPKILYSKKLRKLYYLSTRVKPRVKKKVVRRIDKLKIGN